MGKIVLHGIELSPPVRAVLLTLNALELEYEFKEVDLIGGEHKSPEYTKKNPQQTVPALEDDGLFIGDSHAIIAYLARKYAKDDSLYPKDYYKRAIVDHRLHFDSSVLFPSLKNITFPLFFKGETNIPQEKIDAYNNSFGFLEAFLENNDYLAGNKLTIADLSAISTVSSFGAIATIDPMKTPKLVAWIDRMSKLSYYEEANGRGATNLNQLLKEKLGKK